jgi:hypothetical protein
MMRRLTKAAVFLFGLIVAASPLWSQTTFQDLEKRFLEIAMGFQASPQNLNLPDAEGLLKNIENHLKQDREPIETFTLLYYSGYLNYMSAFTHPQPQTQLKEARRKFGQSLEVYKDNRDRLNLPEREVFAKYMLAWCWLREYLFGRQLETEKLDQAIKALEAVGSNQLQWKQDIAFLKGLSFYLLAQHNFKQLTIDKTPARIDTLSTGRAIESFAVPESQRQTELGRLSRFFRAASYYLQGQLKILSQLQQSRIAMSNTSAADDFKNAENELNRLAEEDKFEAPAGFAYRMAVLQGKILGTSSASVGGLENLTQTQRMLIQTYDRLINSRVSDQSGIVPDTDQPWLDDNYSSFLNENSPQLLALRQFYAKERSAITNEQTNFTPLDEKNLMPFLQERNRFLDSYLKFRNQHGRLRQEFVTMNREEVKRFAEYFLSLDRPHLYEVAQSGYQYLHQQAQGYEREKMALAQAFCLYKLGQYDQLLQSLRIDSDNQVASLSDPRNQNEARYYRAMTYRIIDRQLYSENVLSELELIQDNHPNAGYGVAYGQTSRVNDTRLFSNTCSQACSDQQRFQEICRECTRIRYTPIENPRPIIVGDEDVRFERLNTLPAELREREKQFQLRVWQVFSSPLHLPMPDRGEAAVCFDGPKEFYLAQRIPITLNLGSGDKQVAIRGRGEIDCDTLFTTDASTAELDVFALRPYQIIVAKSGSFPTIIDTTFRNKGDKLDLTDYDLAVQVPESETNIEKGLDGQFVLDFDGDYSIVLKNDHPRGVTTVLSSNGKAFTNGAANFSAIAAIGETYYVLDRGENKIYRFTNRNPKPVQMDLLTNLNEPSDLAAQGNYLFIACSGDNTIVKFNHTDGKIEKETPVQAAGQIESIAVISNRIYVSDWKNNNILSADLNLGGFLSLSEVDRARANGGMIAPVTLSAHGDTYLAVSDIFANKVFLFHKSGQYLTAFSLPGGALPRGVQISKNELTVYQANGMVTYALKPDDSYFFERDYSLKESKTDDSGASQFCLF